MLWSVILFVKHIEISLKSYGNIIYGIVIPIYFIYALVYTYLLGISLKWYTIISSIEMKRNEKCLKKTINYQLKTAAQISNDIFTVFKRLYFDIKTHNKDKDNFNTLGKVVCQNLVGITYSRFLKLKQEATYTQLNQSFPINVSKELKAFLKSCGLTVDEKEIEYMLHLVENYSDDKLTIEQLYDIWGAHLHFSSLPPEEILHYVFDEYFKRRDDIEPVCRGDFDGLNSEKIDHFLEFYNEYFSYEQVLFIREETRYLGKSFSRDAFCHMLLAPRRYYPY
jgi:hypothetical protein